MNVVAECIVVENEDTDVASGTEVNKLTNGILKESFIDERVENPLNQRYRQTTQELLKPNKRG